MVFSLRPNYRVSNELLESVFISKFLSIYLKIAVFFFLDHDVDFQEWTRQDWSHESVASWGEW